VTWLQLTQLPGKRGLLDLVLEARDELRKRGRVSEGQFKFEVIRFLSERSGVSEL